MPALVARIHVFKHVPLQRRGWPGRGRSGHPDQLVPALAESGVPVGFREIRLSFDVETDAPQQDVDRLLELTDRYCVVFQTLQNSPTARAQMNVIRPRAARTAKAKS